MKRFPFAHTFSIVAHDPETGQMGVAVQSHWFSVGSVVTWAEPGVGVVATQALVEMSYGPLGLEKMRNGLSGPQALVELLAADELREVRQVAMVDAQGCNDVHSGKRCMEAAGHVKGEGFSVQANMMLNDTVWPAMADAYRSAQGDLAERLLVTLEAAQTVGGDVRGQQSAAILIVQNQKPEKSWEGKVMELRVEDHPQPIVELRRLVQVQRAYEHMNRGDALLGKGDVEGALEAYRSAAEIAPSMDELPFWHAVTLTDLDRLEEALPIFQEVFWINSNWAVLLTRLPPAGMMKENPQALKRILALIEENHE